MADTFSLYPVTDSSHASTQPRPTCSSPHRAAAPPLPLPAATAPIVTARVTEQPGWSRVLPLRCATKKQRGRRGRQLSWIDCSRADEAEDYSSRAAAMSVELIMWLFSFASVMVLIGLTAYQASPTITPFASLKGSRFVGESSPNLAGNRPTSAQFRDKAARSSWGFDGI